MSHFRPSTRPAAPGLEWLLRAACAVMFAGHAWLCLDGVMPLRALLWDESLASGPVRVLTGLDWDQWVSSPVVEARIDAAIRLQGWVFLALAAAALVPGRGRFLAGLLVFGAADLAFLAWLKFHDAGVGIAQFFEHGGQFLLPVVLAIALRRGTASRGAVRVAQMAVVLTFVGHGLFAIGLPSEVPLLDHSRPGRFTEMTVLCLGLSSEAVAGGILLAAGVLDLVAAALVFADPRLRARRWALAYMVGWGFLTALARPWAYFEPTAAADSLARWLPEMLYRAPHFALPLFLLLVARSPESADRTSPLSPARAAPPSSPGVAPAPDPS